MGDNSKAENRNPLDGIPLNQRGRLAFNLVLISAQLLEESRGFEHIDRSWVGAHLYLNCPDAPPTSSDTSSSP